MLARLSCVNVRRGRCVKRWSRLSTTPGKDRGHGKVPDRADNGSRHAGEPPSMARGEGVGRHPDIVSGSNPTNQVEDEEPAQQRKTTQPLVTISKLIIEKEIRGHRHHGGHALCHRESEPERTQAYP